MVDLVGQILTVVSSVLLTVALVFGLVGLILYLAKKKRGNDR